MIFYINKYPYYPYFPNALLNNELNNKTELFVTFYLLYLGWKNINYVNMEEEIKICCAVTNTAIMLHYYRWEFDICYFTPSRHDRNQSNF